MGDIGEVRIRYDVLPIGVDTRPDPIPDPGPLPDPIPDPVSLPDPPRER